MTSDASERLKPQRKSLRGANLLLLATTLVAGLLLAEVMTRWFIPYEATPLGGYDPTGLLTYDPELGFVMTPHFAGPWARGVFVETNSIGLRDKDYGPKNENEIRILSLGDSYAFGFGVELSSSYAKVLERNLSESLPGVDVSVINGAVSGYSTHQQILMFEKLFPLLKPDFVLATFVGGNDVYENAAFHEALREKANTPVGWLGRQSHLVRLVLQAIFPATYFLSNRWEPNIDYTIGLLADLEQRLKAKNVPFLMLVIPARHQIRPDVHPGSRLLGMLGFEWLIQHQNEKVMAHFESTHTPYVDLRPALVNHDRVERVSFADDSHTNAVGHRVIAEEIFRRIRGDIAKLRAIDPRSSSTSNVALPHHDEERAPRSLAWRAGASGGGL
jgi:lysophospholipase L1-like esterase